MSNVYKFPDPDAVSSEACEWLARIERGLTDQEEDAALHEWLGRSPNHSSALMETAALWDRMDSLSRLADLFPKTASRQAQRRAPALAMAASLLIAVMVGLFLTMAQPKAPQLGSAAREIAESRPTSPIAYRHRFQTDIGERSTIRLPDGSQLILNTNSRVYAEFGDTGRKITLEQGEFYIRVAHDTARPLTVFAGDKLVRAVGTEFSVEITSDQRVEVIVTEGKVLIGVMPPKSKAATSNDVINGTPVVAGQRILLGHEDQVLKEVGSEELTVKLSWREGKLIFHGQPLRGALDEIERYTPVEFIIQDESLNSIRVAGMFKAGDVDGLLETLEQNFNIAYERTGPEQIVLKAN